MMPASSRTTSPEVLAETWVPLVTGTTTSSSCSDSRIRRMCVSPDPFDTNYDGNTIISASDLEFLVHGRLVEVARKRFIGFVFSIAKTEVMLAEFVYLAHRAIQKV